jgi:hydroxylamine dehydrogenase
MSLESKRIVVALLSAGFLVSLIFVQWREVTRREAESGRGKPHISVPASSRACVDCHKQSSPGLVAHWEGSKHALRGVGCIECHEARRGEVDGFDHYGQHIATIVTPNDCAKCHADVAQEFARSHHAKGGNILASLDNFLAEVVEGHRGPFDPHSPTPGRAFTHANGMASANTGCQQCHGSKVALISSDGGMLTVEDFQPGPDGLPTNLDAVARIVKDVNGRPRFHASTWPNTGIGRINLDGSLGSCSACHSRHDFSPRRARQPENCGKCHLGPDHPQKEIYEESKHGVAFRDLHHEMHLDADDWVLGKDYFAAPTCATCHMSGNVRNGGRITHDPGERISWTNRPPISQAMDTDLEHRVVTETDPQRRRQLISDTWEAKRTRMQEVCSVCHSNEYVNNFYKQYDDFVVLYNEKFAKPGARIMQALLENGLRTAAEFDEEVEWTWYLLWHHEGRRARHGASMMAPDYAHWHGMFEVAERFYMQLLPQVREICEHARKEGRVAEADRVLAVLDAILARPEHQWFERDLKELRAGRQPERR